MLVFDTYLFIPNNNFVILLHAHNPSSPLSELSPPLWLYTSVISSERIKQSKIWPYIWSPKGVFALYQERFNCLAAAVTTVIISWWYLPKDQMQNIFCLDLPRKFIVPLYLETVLICVRLKLLCGWSIILLTAGWLVPAGFLTMHKTKLQWHHLNVARAGELCRQNILKLLIVTGGR